MHLKNPSSLEDAWRFCCNIRVINDFFIKNQVYLKDTDGRLIFNADETSSITSKKFKAHVLDKSSIAPISVQKHEAHISTMLCYNAFGYRLKPFIIIPTRKNMPDELKNVDAFIASQCSGWMTNKLFTAFVVYFVATMSTYRLELPAELQDKTIYLLVDNHPSRCNSTAVEFLATHNIKLITFPGHCTHVM